MELCKGLLFAMFFEIHENLQSGLDEALRLLHHYWYDWWDFIVTNGCYTPESFGINFPYEIYPDSPIDLSDCKSDNFEMAMQSGMGFWEKVSQFLDAFMTATYEDYKSMSA